MKLHCLGTTGYHPSPTRHTACYFLPELSLVLDAGTGIFRLVDHLLKNPTQSLTILLSHAHLDHVVGLTFLLDTLAVTSLNSIRVIGEAEKLAAVRQHLYHELLFPVAPTSLQFIDLPEKSGKMPLDHCHVQWYPLEHPGGSLGFTLSIADKKLAYITDTVARVDSDYVNAIRGVDLLLHECYFADQHRELAETTGHSWLSAVTEVVRATQPHRTALIHVNPLAEVLGNGFYLNRQHTELNMCIAEDGMELEL